MCTLVAITIYMYIHMYMYVCIIPTYMYMCCKVPSERPYSCNRPTEFLRLKRLDCQHALCGGTTNCHYHVSAPVDFIVLILRRYFTVLLIIIVYTNSIYRRTKLFGYRRRWWIGAENDGI